MVILADVGGITGFTKTLQSILVPDSVIAEIVKILDRESGYLPDGNLITPVGQQAFGTGGTGQNLSHHTEKAHAKMTNAVLEAVAALQATGEAMEKFEAELKGIDEDSAVVTRTLLARTQQAVDGLDDDQDTPPVSPGTNQGGDN